MLRYGSICLLTVLAFIVSSCGSSVSEKSRDGKIVAQRLAAAKNWLYVLQGTRGGSISVERIRKAGYDLVVTDHSKTGNIDGIFSFREVEKMKGKAGKTIVLCYLSIGEAESYRYYWRHQWSKGERPKFIGPLNPNWTGNFWVRYWDEDWRLMLFGNSSAYLDRIIAAGFDGIYLDKIDAYQEVPEHIEKQNPKLDPRAEMIRLVSDLSTYAKLKKPDFIVVGQNAEELVVDPVYLRAIDGVAKEEAWFAASDRKQKKSETKDSERYLGVASSNGKAVFTVDYCSGENALAVRKRSRKLGFVPFVTDVELTQIPQLALGNPKRVQ